MEFIFYFRVVKLKKKRINKLYNVFKDNKRYGENSKVEKGWG